MKFKAEQHFRMADTLLEKALALTDMSHAAKLVAMARTFRRLAVRAYMATDADMKRRDWSKYSGEAMLPGLIDPPSPWDSLLEWQRYAADLDKMPPSKTMRLLLEEAEETIVRKKLGLL
ncbi:hypothetical protein XH89_20045 [Bradyrhizobium sp. CCBAU 53340]|uniref:hypothetical protein n=1 Tax=Bradyrhizobium sp. CCBAU 53340 TaxID=1325112 RepID=UPI00188C88A0|nr:hypothetical protein [Bradyrhizobium sp. CCBAU 53340]QOZ45519.1 hypothetical protein XH89_20045 [Bradyrhizobium sp. CCBAU 53340]